MAFKTNKPSSKGKIVKPSNNKKYIYKPRSFESAKERSERTGGRFDSWIKPGFDIWRPKAGDNLIRILPPTWENHDHYALEVWMHRFIGADKSNYLCLRKMLNKKDPICEAMKACQGAGEVEDAKALAPVNRYVAWVIDRHEDEDAPPQVFDMSFTMDRDLIAQCIDKKRGSLLPVDHPDKGYDLTIKRQGQGLKTKYFGLNFDREPTPISDNDQRQDEILDFINENPIPSILKYYSYEYLQNVLEGGGEEKDEDEGGHDEEDRDDERPARGRGSRTAQNSTGDEDIDEETASDDDESSDEDEDREDVGEDEDESGESDESDEYADEEDDEAPPPRRGASRPSTQSQPTRNGSRVRR